MIMKRTACLLAAGAVALALTAGPLVAQTIYLQADFDAEPVDQPIGTGGPEMGQPIEVDTAYIIATVRDAPLPSPCLEIRDNHDFSAGSVVFEFIDRVEITAGIVAISFSLWFPEIAPGHSFYVAVREQEGAARKFTNLDFWDNGLLSHEDANSTSWEFPPYDTERALPVAVVFDMDAGTVDVWMDGQLVLEDEDHGVTDRGVGSVRFGCTHDQDLEGRFYVDDILVADSYTSPVAAASWGRIKGLYGGR
jgi:hypothetical protein